MAADPVREAIRREAIHVEQKTQISALAQERAANWWGTLFYLVGTPTAALAALAGGSAVADKTTAAAILAITAAVSASLWAFLNPGDRRTVHREASSRFRGVENHARVFVDVTCISPLTPTPNLKPELDRIELEWNKVDSETPHVAGWIYNRAKKQVEGDFNRRRGAQPRGMADLAPPASSHDR